MTRPSGAWKNGQSVVKSSGIVGEKGGNSKTRTDVRLVTSTVEDMEEEEEEEEEEGEEEEGEEEEGEEEEEDELEEEEGGEKEERKGEVMSESGLTSDSDGYLGKMNISHPSHVAQGSCRVTFFASITSFRLI